MRIDLTEVFRDKEVLSEIRWEIKRKALTGWKPWTILLPPDLLWPMINEISAGMSVPWSPFIDGIPVEVGPQNEIGLKFVLPGMKKSPVHYEGMKYVPSKEDYTVPVEVRHGVTV